MIIYNVTVNVALDVATEWLGWMKEVHIPEVMETSCFKTHKILKLLSERPDVEGPTYAIQYFATDMDDLNRYLVEYSPKLKQDVLERYGEKVLAFRTILEEV